MKVYTYKIFYFVCENFSRKKPKNLRCPPLPVRRAHGACFLRLGARESLFGFTRSCTRLENHKIALIIYVNFVAALTRRILILALRGNLQS